MAVCHSKFLIDPPIPPLTASSAERGQDPHDHLPAKKISFGDLRASGVRELFEPAPTAGHSLINNCKSPG